MCVPSSCVIGPRWGLSVSLTGGAIAIGGFGNENKPSLGVFSIPGLQVFDVSHCDNQPSTEIPPGEPILTFYLFRNQ